MKLLTPGTGNQRANKASAVRFIAERVLDVASMNEVSGEIVTSAGDTFTVSAYAETTAAFVKTPGKDKDEYSIYASGHRALMVRQLKDGRIFVYQLDSRAVEPRSGSSSVPWEDIRRAAERTWVCQGDKVREFGKS